MFIKITEVKFKNFMSYIEETTFTPENGVVLINGSNGKGKCVRGSTEVEILITESNINKDFEDFLLKKLSNPITSYK
jgi:hypothetical protein